VVSSLQSLRDDLTSKRLPLVSFNFAKQSASIWFSDDAQPDASPCLESILPHLNSRGVMRLTVGLPAKAQITEIVWPECEGVSYNTKTEGLCKNVNPYICDESVGQGVSIDREGYSQPLAANHMRILLSHSYYWVEQAAVCLY
jgi:hypothetical protein